MKKNEKQEQKPPKSNLKRMASQNSDDFIDYLQQFNQDNRQIKVPQIKVETQYTQIKNIEKWNKKQKMENKQLQNLPNPYNFFNRPSFNIESNQPQQKQERQKLSKKQAFLDLHEDPQFFSTKYRIIQLQDLRKENFNDSINYFQNKIMTILTWNVWKQKSGLRNSNMDQRYTQIIKVINAKNPSIICLQETEDFRRNFLINFLNTSRGKQYSYSDCSWNSTIILSKAPANFYQIKFKNGLKSKPLSICYFNIKCFDGKVRSLIIHSIHLKAFPQCKIVRQFQLRLLQKINKKFDLVIMAGDFNIDDGDQENSLLKYNYLDLQKHKINRYENDSQPMKIKNKLMQQQQQKLQQKDQNMLLQQFLQQRANARDGQNQQAQRDYCEESSDYFSQTSFDEDSQGSYEIVSDQSQNYYQQRQFKYSNDSDSSDDQRKYFYDRNERTSRSFNRGRTYYNNKYRTQYNKNFYFIQQSRQPQFGRYNLPSDYGDGPSIDLNALNARQNQRYRSRQRPGHLLSHQRNQANNSTANQVPKQTPSDTFTYLFFKDKSRKRYDRILMKSSHESKIEFKKKINVNTFDRLGNYSVGIHRGKQYMRFLKDGKVRAPSDHIGLFTSFFLNYQKEGEKRR